VTTRQRAIHQKLGPDNRRTAVLRARTVGLLVLLSTGADEVTRGG
jgi:hypothetical protein